MKKNDKYPRSIENGGGEKIIFLGVIRQDGRDVLELENEVEPGHGPPMHVHFMQDESLTVVAGRLGYQYEGGEKQYAEAGETVVFHAGKPHRFWADGGLTLKCTGWVSPPHNIEYFLTELYKTTRENGGKKPGNFEGAYLLRKYHSEFDMLEIPGFVKKVIFPITVFFGKLAGKHKQYQEGPLPVQ